MERTWIVEAIGEKEVVGHCTAALEAIGSVIKGAIALGAGEFDPTIKLPDLKRFTVFLESDVDPSLRKKWGGECPTSHSTDR